jgi:hypothetical protein
MQTNTNICINDINNYTKKLNDYMKNTIFLNRGAYYDNILKIASRCYECQINASNITFECENVNFANHNLFFLKCINNNNENKFFTNILIFVINIINIKNSDPSQSLEYFYSFGVLYDNCAFSTNFDNYDVNKPFYVFFSLERVCDKLIKKLKEKKELKELIKDNNNIDDNIKKNNVNVVNMIVETKDELKMIIGVNCSISDESIKRQFNVSLSNVVGDNKICENQLILNMYDLIYLCFLQSFTNKFKLINFDWSTTKFLEEIPLNILLFTAILNALCDKGYFVLDLIVYHRNEMSKDEYNDLKKQINDDKCFYFYNIGYFNIDHFSGNSKIFVKKHNIQILKNMVDALNNTDNQFKYEMTIRNNTNQKYYYGDNIVSERDININENNVDEDSYKDEFAIIQKTKK